MLSERAASMLQVRRSEGRLVALTMALMFVPSAGAAIGIASAESLFLSRVGADALPRLYIILGLITIFTTLGITALLGRVAPVRFYLFLPILLALLLGAARLLVNLDLVWVYGTLWVAVFLFDTLLNLMLWGMAGMAFDTRQAKRLFPLLGAAGILGLALGGLITRPLVKQLGTENLLLIWALTLLFAFGLARVLALRIAEIRTAPKTQRRSQRRTRVRDDIQAGFHYVHRSRLMRWIAVAAVLFYMLFFLLAFPFSKAVEQQYPVEDVMTGFLGVFRGLTTGVALLISLLLATRFYASFGLIAGVLALALLDLLGFSVLSISTSFAAIVGFRFIHEIWLGGVTRTAWYALFNVVPPTRREQTRMFINGVCLQAGVVLVGLLLLIGNQVLAAQQLFIIGLMTAALTLFAMWRARQAYLGALVDGLRSGRQDVFISEENPFGSFEHDATALTVAEAGLADSNPAVRHAAAEILGDLAAAGALPALINAVTDPDPQVRAAVLLALARTEAGSVRSRAAVADGSARKTVAAHLADTEPEVRVQAINALCQLVKDDGELTAYVEPMLEDPESVVRAEAAVTMLKIGPHPRAAETLQQMAAAENTVSRVAALEGLGTWGDSAAYEPAVAALNDSRPAVRRAAARALAQIDDTRCPEPLVRALGDEDASVRAALATAIGAIGPPALATVVSALSEPALEDGALEALGKLPVDTQSSSIRAYISERTASALHYDGLGRAAVSAELPKDGRQLLADSLRYAAARDATNALRAVGLLGDGDAVAAAIEGLNGPDLAQRANAVEILDSIAERETVQPVLQLWEPDRDIALTDGSSTRWLLDVLRDQDPWLRAGAALAAGAYETNEVHPELRQLAESDPDPTVRATAVAALNGGNQMETLPTLPLMERVLFLRRVPLFAELTPGELKQVAAIAREYVFVDGETISRQNDLGDELYVIVSGEVLVRFSADGKADEQLARRRAGDYVGEMSIISREPRMASLVAAGNVRTLNIDRTQFEGILRERPETSLAVMRVLCERLRERGSNGLEAYTH